MHAPAGRDTMPVMLRPATAFALLAAGLAAQRPEPESVDAACARIRPTADDARWTLIPWHRSLGAALAEAARANRPVFLFVNDGDVDTGRC